MSSVLDDILLPAIAESINPERVYRFNHPAFEGNGCRAYRTLLIIPKAESRERFDALGAETAKLNLEGYGYIFCFQKQAALAELMERGHLFYSLVCQRKNLVYEKGHQKLEITPTERLKQVILKARVDLVSCMERITAFLDGARFYEDKGNLPMAAFMLQQVVELLFRAVELVMLGNNEHCHLIRTHIALCKPMVPGMCAAFPLEAERDHALLQLLNDAYLNVRYREQYVISEKDLREVMERASRMVAIMPREVEAAIKIAEITVKERMKPAPVFNTKDTNQ